MSQTIYQEKEWLIQAAAGNEQSFSRLFNLYHQQLGIHIFRLTDSMELAEEVVQDVFLKIWMNRETLAGIHNFRAYLFVVSKNHAINAMRQIVKERLLKKELENIQYDLQLSPPNKYYSLLDEAIDHLPAQQQKVYLLSRHKRLKYAEIAKELNISHETVKKYLQLAVNSIRIYLQSNINKTLIMTLLILNFIYFKNQYPLFYAYCVL